VTIQFLLPGLLLVGFNILRNHQNRPIIHASTGCEASVGGCFPFFDPSLPSLLSLPRTAARSILLNADGSSGDKVIITYLNPLLFMR